MNKKVMISLVSVLLIIGIAFFYMVMHTPVSIPNSSEKASTITKDNQKTKEDSPQPDVKNQFGHNKDSEKTKEPLKDFIHNAITDTIIHFPSKHIRVVAIGDSLTEGVGDETGNGGYVGILDNMINQHHQYADFQNFGKRGNRTDQLLKRLDKPEIKSSIKKADIVLITIGANDIMKIVKHNITDLNYQDFASKRDDYKKRLQQIFQKIHGLNAHTKIYLLGFYNPFAKYFADIKELDTIVINWNETGKEVASHTKNGTFIPIKDLFANASLDLLAEEDHFHPNTLGYERMAKRVLTYLTK